MTGRCASSRDMYAGHPLEPAVTSGLELRRQVAQSMQQLSDEMRTSSRDALSIKGFELEAERMARLMRDSYRIAFIDVGGWDTHVNEGAAQGALASNLTGLGRGLSLFGVASLLRSAPVTLYATAAPQPWAHALHSPGDHHEQQRTSLADGRSQDHPLERTG